jgi:hypothetical protein
MAKIYVAGPMRGYCELNFPAFNDAAMQLAFEGWEVVNPVDINPDPETPYETCMKRDIAELVKCDAIYMLQGWIDSAGAKLEFSIASSCGLKIFYQEEYEREDD